MADEPTAPKPTGKVKAAVTHGKIVEPQIEPSPPAPSPETFTLVVSAVFDIQGKLGEQSKTVETLNTRYMEQREDIRILEKLIESKVLELTTAMTLMNRTLYAGWILLITIGGIAAWTIYRVWEVILPLIQMKLGIPVK